MHIVGKYDMIGNMPQPTKDIEGIKRFFFLRYIENREYRDIRDIMKKDLKTLTRWNKYIKSGVLPNIEVGKLSTGRRLTVGKRSI